MKIDIGCGGKGTRHEGFIGIDLWPEPPLRAKDSQYIQMDFINDFLPVGWHENTVDEAIALHVIEHMLPCDGEELIKKAVMLLKPGATLTVTCPDLRILATKYIEEDDEFWEKRYAGGKYIWPGNRLADRLNYAIHQAGHKWSYDLTSLMALTTKAVGAITRFEPIKPDNKYNTRKDHETGVVITKK